MDEKKKISKTGLVILVVIAILLVIRTILPAIYDLKMFKAEGKTESASDVINIIVEILKNRDESELKKYISEDFSYYFKRR